MAIATFATEANKPATCAKVADGLNGRMAKNFPVELVMGLVGYNNLTSLNMSFAFSNISAPEATSYFMQHNLLLLACLTHT